METTEKKIDNLEELSNNEILFYIKQLEADHEAIKLKMLNDYDKMVEIEKTYEKANLLLVKRLKGDK
jgi:ubiquinone biosynthesis protein COQ9